MSVSTELKFTSQPYESIGGEFHTLSLGDVELLSTNNKETAIKWLGIFETTSLSDIFNDKVNERHGLMVQLSCAGSSSLAKSYFEARAIRESLINAYIDSFPANSAARMFAKGNAPHNVSDSLFKKTGWRFSQ